MMTTLIIAEAGVNHNGSLKLAKQLVDEAAIAGADIIKFQTFKSEKLVSIHAPQAEYQRKNTGNQPDTSQINMLKKLELSEVDHIALIDYCGKRGIKFLSTAFDMESIDFLRKLNLGLWKIPSGELTNYPYLKKIASFNEPVILSTGMCEYIDIDAALNVLYSTGLSREKITLLHCNTEYPTPFEDVNLLAMQEIKSKYGTQIGYSDHTEGIEIPIAAVALGATVIEKHFTLNRSLPGPDHKASIEPAELRCMVKSIRNIEKALGNGHKSISNSERKNINIARKSIVAKCSIRKGEMFTETNLTVKRPGTGLSPMKWNDVIGKMATKNYNIDDFIEL